MTTESINQMEAAQVETGDIQMEAVKVENSGIQTEAVQVENGVLQTEAGKVEIGGIQMEAGQVEIGGIQMEAGGIQTEAGQVEISGIQTEDGPVEIGDIQTEAGQVEIGDIQMETGQVEIGVNALANPPAQAEHFDSPKFESTVASSTKKRKLRSSNQDSQVKDTPPIAGVSNCYPFKSRLQEYCNKAGLTSPVYEIIKEGSSQEHSYRSTVIVNNVRYDSPPGFFNRKAAQHSAAEVALKELANSVDKDFGISQPVHEIGLCKSLLQEYAQKMNYAIPSYECREDEEQGKTPMFSCVVEVGGIKYVGASATTKKEATIKAARTAMLAIQAAASLSENQTDNSVYTVVPPPKKMVSDLGISTEGPTAAAEPSKSRLRKLKKKEKKKQAVKTSTSVEGTTCLEVDTDSQKKEVPNLGISAVGPQAVPKLSRSQRLKLKREKMMQALIGTSGEGTTCPEVNTDSQVKSCTSGEGATCSEVNTDSQVKIGTSGEGMILSEVNTDSQDTLAIQSGAPLFENQTPSTVIPVIPQNEKVPEPVFRNMAPTTEARTRRNRLKAEKRKNKKQALKGLTSGEGTTSVEVKTEGPTSAVKPKKRDFKNQDWKKKRLLFKNYTSRGGPNSWNRAGTRVVGPAMPPHHYMDEGPNFIPIRSQHCEWEMPPTRMHNGMSYHMDDRETGGVSYHMDERVTDGGSYLMDDRETGGMSYHMDDRVTGGMSYHMDDRETGYITYPWVPPPMNTIYQKYA